MCVFSLFLRSAILTGFWLNLNSLLCSRAAILAFVSFVLVVFRAADMVAFLLIDFLVPFWAIRGDFFGCPFWLGRWTWRTVDSWNIDRWIGRGEWRSGTVNGGGGALLLLEKDVPSWSWRSARRVFVGDRLRPGVPLSVRVGVMCVLRLGGLFCLTFSAKPNLLFFVFHIIFPYSLTSNKIY